jgi:hypothetical protein
MTASQIFDTWRKENCKMWSRKDSDLPMAIIAGLCAVTVGVPLGTLLLLLDSKKAISLIIHRGMEGQDYIAAILPHPYMEVLMHIPQMWLGGMGIVALFVAAIYLGMRKDIAEMRKSIEAMASGETPYWKSPIGWEVKTKEGSRMIPDTLMECLQRANILPGETTVGGTNTSR